MATATPKKTVTAVAATLNAHGDVLHLTFANGETLSIDSKSLSPAIAQAALMHGLKQKLIDAAAIGRDPESGRSATIDDKYRAVKEVFDRITRTDSPEWNKTRATGEGTGNGKGGILVTAMMRLTSKSRAEILSFLEDKTKEEVAALRKNPRIVEIMAQIQVEQANTSGIDSDSLLDGLMDGSDMGGDIGSES